MKALRADILPTEAEDLMSKVKAQVDQIEEIMGAGVLVIIWRRPEKTKGGLYLPDKTKEEDIYQGKVGLIAKLGPLAFKEDDRHKWPGRVPQVGDWVAFRVGDAWPFILNEQHCRIVEDVNVRMVLRTPDVVY